MKKSKANELDKDGAKRGTSATVDHLQYVRLRAPKRDGQTLDIPDDEHVNALLRDNQNVRQSRATSQTALASDFPLTELQTLARTEVVQLAAQWSSQYLPEHAQRDAKSIDASAPIVCGGHQPALFHPGVWYKNFRLHQIAQASGATAINLVVDNDLSAASTIKFPKKNSRATVGLVEFDAPGSAVPFEMRHIVDRKVFESFGQRAADSITPWVDEPIVKRLWPEVIKAENVFDSSHTPATLAHAIAAGRHVLEHNHGLRTLELPLSRLAGCSSFAKFSGYLIDHLGDFRDTYNSALTRYRAQHGIRSSAHPVPELTSTQGGNEQWIEAPFWIWTDQSPHRKPLFVRRAGNELEVSNSETTLAKISATGWSSWLVEQNQQIQATGKGIFIRPRALITTMFARLLASDLFVHGIGGAKYDQLTDQIIADFFGVVPPRYVTATGTWRLPTGFPEISHADVTARKEALRNIRFHPETFITSPDDETSRLIESKRAAIAGQAELTLLQRHNAIESVNLELQQLLEPTRAKIVGEMETLSEQIRDSQILNSREYSFCLHPTELMARFAPRS